jgi:hypothetical protein
MTVYGVVQLGQKLHATYDCAEFDFPFKCDLLFTSFIHIYFVYIFILQSLASTATFVYSQHLLLHWQLLILVIFGAIGSILFFVAEHVGLQRDRSQYVLIPASP